MLILSQVTIRGIVVVFEVAGSLPVTMDGRRSTMLTILQQCQA